MKTLTPIRLDRSRQAVPQVLEHLRKAIMSLELPPGHVMVRQDIADQFGVSQTPVREALLRLSEEGLVDVFPQYATLVSRIHIGAARQAHFLRRAIELELVHQLAKQPPEGLVAEMQRLIAQQAQLAQQQQWSEFVEADRQFHRTMYEAANMPQLWEVVMRSSGHVDRLRRLHLPSGGKAAAIVQDHRAITEGIEAQHPEQAQHALRQHLSGTLSAVDSICEAYPDYVDQGELPASFALG